MVGIIRKFFNEALGCLKWTMNCIEGNVAEELTLLVRLNKRYGCITNAVGEVLGFA